MAKTNIKTNFIGVVAKLIIWYYCLNTINAQSFSVLFGREPTGTSTTKTSGSGSVTSQFPQHGLTKINNESTATNSNPPFSIFHTFRRYFEWIISYFTFASGHFQEVRIESQSLTYGNSNQYAHYSYHQRFTTTTHFYLHSQPERNTSPRSTSNYYDNRFYSQHPHPWNTRLSYGRPSYQHLHILGSPYRSYSYNIPCSYGRSCNRLRQT